MAGTLRSVAAALLLAAGVASAEIIDRVLAVVGDQIITLSDVRAALRFGLVPPDVSQDPVAAALQRLIDRRLVLAEVERYAPAEPPDSAVDAGVAAIHARFEDAPAFEIALNQTALSHEELRRHVRDSIRIETYLQQRFASMIQPTDEEVIRYYGENPDEFTVDGMLQPLSAVEEAVRARVIEQRKTALADDWLEGLRRRGTVSVLYLPGQS